MRRVLNSFLQFMEEPVQQVFIALCCDAVGRSAYPPRYTGLGTMPHSTGADKGRGRSRSTPGDAEAFKGAQSSI